MNEKRPFYFMLPFGYYSANADDNPYRLGNMQNVLPSQDVFNCSVHKLAMADTILFECWSAAILRARKRLAEKVKNFTCISMCVYATSSALARVRA